MGRQGFRSISLFPQKRTESPSCSRICNSAPTNVLPVQDEDWDLEPLSESSFLPVLAAVQDDETNCETKGENGERTVEAAATKDQPTRIAGDFTDFLDSSSSDSDSIVVDEESDSDEPYEYWTKRTSYSYSPFSNNSSFSFEDSDHEDLTCVSRDTSDEDILRAPSLLAIRLQKYFRLSDIGPIVKRGWTSGPESFEGPTSI
ncbi:hypothetical protein DVH05_013467 [Phytophthora capsici]|nr:hypothetical protein DVH05_013467 [Phytophthora capsici]